MDSKTVSTSGNVMTAASGGASAASLAVDASAKAGDVATYQTTEGLKNIADALPKLLEAAKKVMKYRANTPDWKELSDGLDKVIVMVAAFHTCFMQCMHAVVSMRAEHVRVLELLSKGRMKSVDQALKYIIKQHTYRLRECSETLKAMEEKGEIAWDEMAKTILQFSKKWEGQELLKDLKNRLEIYLAECRKNCAAYEKKEDEFFDELNAARVAFNEAKREYDQAEADLRVVDLELTRRQRDYKDKTELHNHASKVLQDAEGPTVLNKLSQTLGIHNPAELKASKVAKDQDRKAAESALSAVEHAKTPLSKKLNELKSKLSTAEGKYNDVESKKQHRLGELAKANEAARKEYDDEVKILKGLTSAKGLGMGGLMEVYQLIDEIGAIQQDARGKKSMVAAAFRNFFKENEKLLEDLKAASQSWESEPELAALDLENMFMSITSGESIHQFCEGAKLLFGAEKVAMLLTAPDVQKAITRLIDAPRVEAVKS